MKTKNTKKVKPESVSKTKDKRKSIPEEQAVSTISFVISAAGDEVEMEEIEILEEEIECHKTEIAPLEFPCDICGDKLATRDDRNEHIQNHFRTYECSICQQTFTGDRQFEYHQQSGHCEPPLEDGEPSVVTLECTMCEKTNFQSSRSLKLHISRFHTVKKQRDDCANICTFCGKNFANIHILKNHVTEIHTNSQRFECKDCGRLFNRLANLRHHELIHENKMPCKCSICGKAFRTSSAVRLHLRMHTGEKPYSCDLCVGKSYSYNTDLVRHKRSAHGIVAGKTYQCDLCPNVYYEPKHIRNHMKRTHGAES